MVMVGLGGGIAAEMIWLAWASLRPTINPSPPPLIIGSRPLPLKPHIIGPHLSSPNHLPTTISIVLCPAMPLCRSRPCITGLLALSQLLSPLPLARSRPHAPSAALYLPLTNQWLALPLLIHISTMWQRPSAAVAVAKFFRGISWLLRQWLISQLLRQWHIGRLLRQWHLGWLLRQPLMG